MCFQNGSNRAVIFMWKTSKWISNWPKKEEEQQPFFVAVVAFALLTPLPVHSANELIN